MRSGKMSLGADKILDQFKTKIQNYFNSLTSEKNVYYVDYIEDIIIAPEETREYTLSLPVEKKKKIDYVMATEHCSMSTLATIKFKNFPISRAMIRVTFPSVLFGVNGIYPKVVISADLNTSWPGDFGLVWEGITGVMKYAFHPYENRDKKLEEIINFYQDDIVDPLCDFLNSSTNKVAVKLREGIHNFLRMHDRAANRIKTLEDDPKDHFWYYSNPFSKKSKGPKNIIEIPIYCEFFDEQAASILYFESYGLKKSWLPPADAIFDIMQYIALAIEMFDEEGNLKSDAVLKEFENKVKETVTQAQKLERKKKAAEAKATWDPFKAKKDLERDSLGFAVRQDDGTVLKKDEFTEKKIEEVKEILHTKPSAPKVYEPAPPSSVPEPTPIAPTPTPEPEVITLPEPTSYIPKYQDTLKQVETMKEMMENIIPPKPTMEVPQPEPGAVEEPDPSKMWGGNKGIKDKLKKTAALVPSPAPVPTPAVSAPSAPSFSNGDEFFNSLQMTKFELVGDGKTLSFRDRGDFTILNSLNPPFILSFARDRLRTKKSLTSSESVDILFKLYKGGHIRPL